MSANKTVAEQHAIIGNVKGTGVAIERTAHPEAQWFFEPVQLGLFIHYGISTVHGDLDISWGMMENPQRRKKGNGIVTPREYWALAERFNPENYNPMDWLGAAKEAGFTYAVLTTKHHDGYCLWPSDTTDFSTKTYMNGRDLVGEYVEACRALGLKVGLYYSPPDWKYNSEYRSFMYASRTESYPDRKHKDIDHNDIEGDMPVMSKEHYDGYVAYVNAQIRELLTRYGKIDLLWLDGSMPDLTNVITIDEMRALQPQIIVNDRLWGFGIGDYCSQYECYLPSEKPNIPWETCQIWHVGGGWSYVKNADKYRELPVTLNQYRVCKEWGGNLLLNIAPRADGSVPDAYYRTVKEFGEAIKNI